MKVTLVGINSVFEFEIYAAVIVRGTSPWDVTPYSLVKADLLFGISHCLPTSWSKRKPKM
jgi:hypothetical protein